MEAARIAGIEGWHRPPREQPDCAPHRFRGCHEPRGGATPARQAQPEASRQPAWRPFQLAFILLNLAGLVDQDSRRIARRRTCCSSRPAAARPRPISAWRPSRIAHRRLTGPGAARRRRRRHHALHAAPADPRPARPRRRRRLRPGADAQRPETRGRDGPTLLGDWPIEIGLWVGSDASPNRLGGKGDADDDTAVGRVRRYRNGRTSARRPRSRPAPGAARRSSRHSFACTPNDARADEPGHPLRQHRLRLHAATAPLPILTVDEPIYRRLPGFLIATVDKFAGLPWVGRDRRLLRPCRPLRDDTGFYGAASPAGPAARQRLVARPARPDHPGRAAPDLGPARHGGGPLRDRDRPARRRETSGSSASGRRSSPRRPRCGARPQQIAALFDRRRHSIFPPPGLDRADSFFAQTCPRREEPARLYSGSPPRAAARSSCSCAR